MFSTSARKAPAHASGWCRLGYHEKRAAERTDTRGQIPKDRGLCPASAGAAFGRVNRACAAEHQVNCADWPGNRAFCTQTIRSFPGGFREMRICAPKLRILAAGFRLTPRSCLARVNVWKGAVTFGKAFWRKRAHPYPRPIATRHVVDGAIGDMRVSRAWTGAEGRRDEPRVTDAAITTDVSGAQKASFAKFLYPYSGYQLRLL